MKAKLTYKLPEDNESFMQAIKAQDMAIVLWDIVYNTKKSLLNELDDNNNQNYLDGYYKGVKDVLDKLNYLLDRYSIDIDSLIS